MDSKLNEIEWASNGYYIKNENVGTPLNSLNINHYYLYTSLI